MVCRTVRIDQDLEYEKHGRLKPGVTVIHVALYLRTRTGEVEMDCSSLTVMCTTTGMSVVPMPSSSSTS